MLSAIAARAQCWPIHGPFSASDLNAKPGTWKYAFGFGKRRPLPRFAIWQGSTWRCIDDEAISRTNSSCTYTHETICCDRPDALIRIGLRFHALGSPQSTSHPARMGGGTDDASAPYRRVPSSDPAYAVIMLAVPKPDGSLDDTCFCLPGHNFGL